MKNKIILTLLLFAIFSNLKAQQTNIHSLYNQNNYLMNPAFAGSNGCFNAYLNYRNQWVGVGNSPQTNTLTLDTRLGKKHGLGLDTRMYKAGLLNNLNAKLTYAYHLPLNEKTFFSAGVSLGVIQQQFRATDAIASSYNDALLIQGNNGGIGFTSDIGLAIVNPKFKIGVSVPQLFSQGLTVSFASTETDFQLKQHINAFVQWNAIQNENWNVAPSVFYRSVINLGHQMDAGIRANWKDLLGIGAYYRTSYGIVGMVDLKIKDKLKLAYAYEFGNGSVTRISKGSHEVMLGITICKKEKTKEDPIEIAKIPIVDSIPETVVEPIIEKEEPVIVEEKKDSIVPVETIEKPKYDASVFDIKVKFQLDDTGIPSESYSNLDKIAKVMKENPELELQITGHSCDLGDESVKNIISLKRAQNVREYLIKKGVGAKKVSAIGKGDTDNLAPNSTEENRQKNRRVEFKLK